MLLRFLINFIKIARHGLNPGVPKANCACPPQGAAAAEVHSPSWLQIATLDYP